MPKINQHVPENEEHLIGTNGVPARYHALLNTPYSHPFSGTGYLVCIEKTYRDLIGAHKQGPDLERLQPPHRVPTGGLDRDLDQQQRTFNAVLDDDKVMFVSHILRYGHSASALQATTDLHYSAYTHSAFGANDNAPRRFDTYTRGWQELQGLEARIKQDLDDARAADRPFTHVMVMSMGWNNDQFEALERYNAIYQHSTRRALAQGRSFNPLVIGLTWPSVWGGLSMSGIANRVSHVSSYANKSMDADEIGFGFANYIVNAMLPRLEASQAGLRSVLIGHSMGARILTRAYYSADTLKDRADRTTPGPVVIGLQGAFSMNRFRQGAQLVPVIRNFTTGEGAPYQEHDRPGGAIALTWAEGDSANPVARFATGAAHVGGKPGSRLLDRHDDLAKNFHRLTLGAPTDLTPVTTAATEVKTNKKVLYIDASKIIASHGDIRNPRVGELVWRLIDALG